MTSAGTGPVESGGEHLLLTVLGLDPKLATYTLGGRRCVASLAPCALLALLPAAGRPDRIIALATPQAEEQTLPLLRDAVGDGYDVHVVQIPDYDGSRDQRAYFDEFLGCVSGAVPREPDIQVTIDITHGLRHLTFLTYVAALYLGALRGVAVRGAYYAILNRQPSESPFLDVRPLLELPRWVHAVTVVGETGSAEPISEILAASADDSANQVVGALRQLTEAYLSGLPLEFGSAVRAVGGQRKTLAKLLRNEHHLPLADELVRGISLAVRGYELHETGDGWKSRVPLSHRELDRQAAFVNDLRRRGAIAQSLGLLREWTVSWAQWSSGDRDGMTTKAVRWRAEAALNALTAMLEQAPLRTKMSDAQQELAAFWRDLRLVRNSYHHHGMTGKVVLSTDRGFNRGLSRVWQYWESLQARPDVPLRVPGSYDGTLLVSPVGTRPGALFSAIGACRRRCGNPAHCLLICSADTEPRIAEALDRARYTGGRTQVLLEDPYGGIAEVKDLATVHASTLVGADRVLVNLTGGTTLMGLVAMRMADHAHSLARPVQRFGLVDRRAPAQQEVDPYLPSDVFWLDETGGSEEADRERVD
jgi:CRISPR-associated DxTHG motif protein